MNENKNTYNFYFGDSGGNISKESNNTPNAEFSELEKNYVESLNNNFCYHKEIKKSIINDNGFLTAVVLTANEIDGEGDIYTTNAARSIYGKLRKSFMSMQHGTNHEGNVVDAETESIWYTTEPSQIDGLNVPENSIVAKFFIRDENVRKSYRDGKKNGVSLESNKAKVVNFAEFKKQGYTYAGDQVGIVKVEKGIAINKDGKFTNSRFAEPRRVIVDAEIDKIDFVDLPMNLRVGIYKKYDSELTKAAAIIKDQTITENQNNNNSYCGEALVCLRNNAIGFSIFADDILGIFPIGDENQLSKSLGDFNKYAGALYSSSGLGSAKYSNEVYNVIASAAISKGMLDGINVGLLNKENKKTYLEKVKEMEKDTTPQNDNASKVADANTDETAVKKGLETNDILDAIKSLTEPLAKSVAELQKQFEDLKQAKVEDASVEKGAGAEEPEVKPEDALSAALEKGFAKIDESIREVLKAQKTVSDEALEKGTQEDKEPEVDNTEKLLKGLSDIILRATNNSSNQEAGTNVDEDDDEAGDSLSKSFKRLKKSGKTLKDVCYRDSAFDE